MQFTRSENARVFIHKIAVQAWDDGPIQKKAEYVSHSGSLPASLWATWCKHIRAIAAGVLYRIRARSAFELITILVAREIISTILERVWRACSFLLLSDLTQHRCSVHLVSTIQESSMHKCTFDCNKSPSDRISLINNNQTSRGKVVVLERERMNEKGGGRERALGRDCNFIELSQSQIENLVSNRIQLNLINNNSSVKIDYVPCPRSSAGKIRG